MSTCINLLIIEDKPADFRLVVRHLERHGLTAHCHCVSNIEELEAALAKGGWDAVLSDYSVPKMDFQHTLGIIQAQHPDLPVILVSGSVGEEKAIELLKLGVWDFVLKDNLTRLVPAIERSLRDAADHLARRQAEAAQRASELRYRRLFESAKDGILILDAETGMVVDVNPFLIEMLGYSHEVFLGKKVWELGFLKDLVANQASFAKLQQTEHIRYENMTLETSTGQQIEVELILTAYLVDRQKVIQCNLRDITSRRAAERELKLLSVALEAAANSIVITDAQGSIRWVNEAFTKSTGYTRAEVFSQNPRVLKSGMHPPEFYAGMWATILAGNVWHGEIHNKRKDGTPFEEDTTITPVRNPASEITHYIAIKQDITEKKELEGRFLRAQRMENIGLLAGGIAHDLNNVLTPILMCAELLQMVTQDESLTRYIVQIQGSAQRGADIVKQVLTFARGIEGIRANLQLRHIIKDMVRMIRETFPRNLRIEPEVAKDLWTMMGDPTQIHQVLLNLCVNARDAMPDGGLLSIRASNVEVDAHLAACYPEAKPGPHVMLTVQDNGLGMAPEVVDRIFEPFFTTKELGHGTGLGLSTVLGISRNHGGFITVESRVNQGTTFAVYFPALPHAAVDALSQQPAPPPRGAGELVLVVDDEPAILQVIKSMLEHHGYCALTASDGTGGLAELSQHPGEVKLVITDIMMPFMDGIQLTRALRRIAPQLPIIASTGALSATDVKDRTRQVQSFGVKTILMKPYKAEELLRAVHGELHPEANEL